MDDDDQEYDESEKDNDSIELEKTEEQQEAENILIKKKQLWLESEKKREEKENKLKSSLKAKKKRHEELKKKIEEKKKLKLKRKQILEDEQRRKKLEKEKKEMAAIQAMAEKELLKERVKQRKENEKNLKLLQLKLKAKRILEDEEKLRNKINKEFALKMSYKIDPYNNVLSIIPNIINNKDEYTVGETGKERLIQYTNKLVKNIKRRGQVFDPGNLVEQIIKKEFNIPENKQVKVIFNYFKYIFVLIYYFVQTKLKKKLEAIESFIKNKKQKNNLSKTIVFRSHYGFNNTIESKNLNNKGPVKPFEDCVPKKYKNVLRCETPDVHCYSNISFNTIVSHWKKEVTDMIIHMQKRRCIFVQNAKKHNKREYYNF